MVWLLLLFVEDGPVSFSRDMSIRVLTARSGKGRANATVALHIAKGLKVNWAWQLLGISSFIPRGIHNRAVEKNTAEESTNNGII